MLKNKKHRKYLSIIILSSVFGILLGCNPVKAESGLVPFSPEVVPVMLKSIMERKLAPLEFKKDDITCTITKINGLAMDWEKAQFRLDCDFRVVYSKSLINLEESGTVSLTGIGLIATDEQKIGAKLLRVNDLKLTGMADWAAGMARLVLDKDLSGKEFWYGGAAPAASETLCKENLDKMLRVALNQVLPLTINDEKNSVTLNGIEKISFREEPGLIMVSFNFNGFYQKLFKFTFVGQASILMRVMVEPRQLTGTITIDRVAELKLDQYPSFLEGIIRQMINGRLTERVIYLSWE